MAKEENKDCFVIMPIADCEGYEKGHFAHVYDDICVFRSIATQGFQS